jgi:hypothetical protein
MTTEIRLWKIQNSNQLKAVENSKLDLEERLEDWIEKDISMLSNDFLVIGRQVPTDFGGAIDLLCMNRVGDLVIIELKRDKTPREISAQVLDYASWVKDLSNDEITNIGDNYLRALGQGSLEEAFRQKFDSSLPDVLNESHIMLVVAIRIDSSSERIIKYLSETYGIKINAVTFQYFREAIDNEYIARTFLITPNPLSNNEPRGNTTKRKPNLSLEKLQEIADKNGAGAYYKDLIITFEKCLTKIPTRSSLAFYGNLKIGKGVIFSLIPTKSNQEEGLKFQVYLYRFMEYFGADKETVLAMLPEKRNDWAYDYPGDKNFVGFEGFFRNQAEIDHFRTKFKELKPV